ncbi:MAG: hypothetical protein PWP44_1113, partial [Thermacetogenium sp.]|nr:hypothetical protein [Thermacetogenium sp.]MDN5376057.1 hypothetical protein [Thermacetogenium sp.]
MKESGGNPLAIACGRVVPSPWSCGNRWDKSKSIGGLALFGFFREPVNRCDPLRLFKLGVTRYHSSPAAPGQGERE